MLVILILFLPSVKGNFMPHLNFLVDVLRDIMTPPNLTAELHSILLKTITHHS